MIATAIAVLAPPPETFRKASLRATAPAVSGFHSLAFFRGGIIAAAPRAAIASWHVAGIEGAVGGDAGDFLIVWDLAEEFG